MDDRLRALTRALTVEQQVALLAGVDTWHTASFADPPVPALRVSDGPAGVRGTSWSGPESASFPCGAALGATFDPAIVEEVGRALARELASKGAHVLLGPTINLARTPVGGRNFEMFGEDPHLTAELAVAYVRGVQAPAENGTRRAVCVKHLVGNDGEFERMTVSVEVDEAVLREVYLAPFEAVVTRAGARAVMAAYNRLNGTYCSEHRWLLTDVLRGEWGFDGVVFSDWFGAHSTAAALAAGLDLEMPGPPIQRGPALLDAVTAGAVPAGEVERAAARVLALGDWVGAAAGPGAEGPGGGARTRDVIRRAAVAATVLLRNDGVLPLAPGSRLALIGPNAEHGWVQGGGSARVRPETRPGPLATLRDRGWDVTFEPGGGIAKRLPALRGDYTVEYSDGAGRSLRAPAEAVSWYWDDPPAPAGGPSPFTGTDFAARVTGRLVPDTTGTWEVGAAAVGPVTVALDGRVVVAIPAGVTGGTFFGMGSDEHRARVELEAGRAYAVEIDYPLHPGHLVRGLTVGARAVPTADPVEAAAAAAAAADVAVVVVGTDDEWETEGEDRTSLALPGDQDRLVAAVAAANPRTVVVVNAGSPVTMPWLEAAAAVVHVWFPGQEIGDALADVLTGAAEPGGRLPVTFPRDLTTTPTAEIYPGSGGVLRYGEGRLVGHRWYDRHDVEPLFPFGFGLGYTTFALAPRAVTGSPAGGAVVTVEVTNTGGRAGSEVVQVYVGPPDDDPARPVRTLAGFAKVTLEPGASAVIDVAAAPRSFRRWAGGAWVVPAGEHRVWVGRSSRHLVEAAVLTAP